MSDSEPTKEPSTVMAEAIEQEEEEVFSSSDPAFWDYVRLKDFTKKTGIDKDDCQAFCAKELFDNACDFIEKWRLKNATIIINVNNDPTDDTLTISVSNPNPSPTKPVFTNLPQTFNYKRSFSSKSNQYKITRGAQGDALKELGTIPYMLINSGEGGEDKQWQYPLVFQHNQKIDKVYVEVDRKNRIIKHRIERSTCKDTDTRVTVTLPTALNKESYKSFLGFCWTYTLFNTHLSFRFTVNNQSYDTLEALLPMSEEYNNPNSIYCYSEKEFGDFLTDIHDKSVSVYDALTRSEFREINQPGRFEDLKDVTIADLTPNKTREVYKRLGKSMLAMSELSTPYQYSKTKRRDALMNRYSMVAPRGLDLDYEKAKYERTEGHKSNDIIRYPFIFEALAIPIRSQTREKSIVISGVNYSTSINNESYFRADSYENGYCWGSEKGVDLTAISIQEIIRVSSAGADIGYSDNISTRKQRQPCVIIAHLVSPRPGYAHGYGKSALQLEPYYTEIARTIEKLVKRMPLRNRTAPSKLYEGPTGNLDLLLQERWKNVRENPGILDPYSAYYDPWTQSTVWYHLREEYLLPIERKYHVTLIKKGTREWITGSISERCEKLEGSPTREQLGIFAAPRATMYVKGQWYRVDINDLPTLAGKGTDVIFIEKQGVVEIIKHLETYGIAFVNTQGHFADYPRDLVPRITEQGGNVVILTDFDCAGIHIAERIIAEDKTGRVKRLGIDMDTIDYFIQKGELKIKVRNEDGDLVEEQITTRDQLLEHVAESYPMPEGKEDKQQPGTNGVNAIIRYASKERYQYIYDNFEYLTGLDITVVDELGLLEDKFTKGEKEVIEEALKERNEDYPDKAKRIELDSVIKVVRANLFSQFILDSCHSKVSFCLALNPS